MALRSWNEGPAPTSPCSSAILYFFKRLTKCFVLCLAEQIRTPITDLFKINHPIMLAGMNVAAGPKLAAAVTNAGGIGVLGGINYTPEMLRDQIDELKSHLKDKNAPFGVDLLLPQIGGNARKTKYVWISLENPVGPVGRSSRVAFS